MSAPPPWSSVVRTSSPSPRRRAATAGSRAEPGGSTSTAQSGSAASKPTHKTKGRCATAPALFCARAGSPCVAFYIFRIKLHPRKVSRLFRGCFFRWKNQGSRGGFESHTSKVLLSLRQLGECAAFTLLAITPDHKRFTDALNHPRLLPVLPCPIEIDGLALCVYHFHNLYPFTRF